MEKELTVDRFNIDSAWELEPCLGWRKKAKHIFDRDQAVAILAAKAINRPLLVTGEPGCGKTQLARAAAQVLEMPLAYLVVNERTEAEDIKWKFDALWRLSDANAGKEEAGKVEKYLSAGPLWWALNRTSAEKLGKVQKHGRPYEGKQMPRSYSNGVLLLIDEIDKADRSIPNSLLETMEKYSFDVPYTGETIEQDEEQGTPLIVITSNREQPLPAAFVRRCLVLDIVLPREEEQFIEYLSSRGEALWGDVFTKKFYRDVAKLLYEKRLKAIKEGARYIPGQAEYLDHIEAVLRMKQFDANATETAAVEELSKLTYSKGI